VKLERMTHEENRELQVLSAAEGYPVALPHYSFKKDLSLRQPPGGSAENRVRI
jgi:hypothetical protein